MEDAAGGDGFFGGVGGEEVEGGLEAFFGVGGQFRWHSCRWIVYRGNAFLLMVLRCVLGVNDIFRDVST